VASLAAFWVWENRRPFFPHSPRRSRHAVRNLVVALLNAVLLAVAFATVTTLVSEWSAQRQAGLLRIVELSPIAHLLLALVLLDGWMYLWHRANHKVPLLWRFHRMHHSDDHMDVTTATRFHPGEQVLASVQHLLLLPALGIDAWHLLVYGAAVIAITQLHHANISLGRWDRPLRWLIVTPYMHKVHHSRLRAEHDSNYSAVFSIWDHLGRSYRFRPDPKTIEFGLEEFAEPSWQSVGGMLKTPLESAPRRAAARFRQLIRTRLAVDFAIRAISVSRSC
jgi:sterol desaturase/sphingolipid hydroxylase (fatty acid hydroxylase superfamily)